MRHLTNREDVPVAHGVEDRAASRIQCLGHSIVPVVANQLRARLACIIAVVVLQIV